MASFYNRVKLQPREIISEKGDKFKNRSWKRGLKRMLNTHNYIFKNSYLVLIALTL